jgi:hypothetical protein
MGREKSSKHVTIAAGRARSRYRIGDQGEHLGSVEEVTPSAFLEVA